MERQYLQASMEGLNNLFALILYPQHNLQTGFKQSLAKVNPIKKSVQKRY